jgi:hypothetical protein
MLTDSSTLSIRVAPAGTATSGVIAGASHRLLTVFLHVEKGVKTTDSRSGAVSAMTGSSRFNLKEWSDIHVDQIRRMLIYQLTENFHDINADFEQTQTPPKSEKSFSNQQKLNATQKLNVMVVDSATEEDLEVGVFIYKVNRGFQPLRTYVTNPDGNRSVKKVFFAYGSLFTLLLLIGLYIHISCSLLCIS